MMNNIVVTKELCQAVTTLELSYMYK
jgi:hypothetical protein